MRRALLVGVLVAVAGCGSGRSSVTGKVTYEDGSAVESGTVIAEATVNGKLVAVQAAIKSDGTFTWGGEREGDGALPGQYKVIVMPITVSDYQASQGVTPNIDGKYGRYESSGLSFEVKPGKNQFNIKVSRPKEKKKEKDDV
jgi:hypothetical protein